MLENLLGACHPHVYSVVSVGWYLYTQLWHRYQIIQVEATEAVDAEKTEKKKKKKKKSITEAVEEVTAEEPAAEEPAAEEKPKKKKKKVSVHFHIISNGTRTISYNFSFCSMASLTVSFV